MKNKKESNFLDRMVNPLKIISCLGPKFDIQITCRKLASWEKVIWLAAVLIHTL